MPQTRSKKRRESDSETPIANRKKNRRTSPEHETSDALADASERDDVVELEAERKKRKPTKKEAAKKLTKKQKTLADTLSRRRITDSARSKQTRQSAIAASHKLPTLTSRKRKAEEPAGEALGDDILKAFDLDIKYGGCMGISRMDRWKRAKRFNLDPPETVLKILSKQGDDDARNQCLWQGQI